ncbi:MAG: hypothetical protein WC560_13035, partial [Syntrophales bacterium]
MKLKKETLGFLFVFLIIAGLFISFEIHPNFPDPDSFYHAKMATTIRDQGFINTFPWFQWTDLKNTYVNPHFLYHILLIPFVTFFNPLIGIKIAAGLFGLGAFAAIYLIARFLKTPYPWLFPLIAAFSQNFLFRMALPRAPSLSIIFLLLATWAMLENRKKTLFLTSIFFVWLYHGWPVIFLSLGALLVANFITDSINNSDTWWQLFKKTFGQQKNNILAATLGILTGLIVNPYFPQNIQFSLLDIFKIGIVNYQSILPVGQEWFPISNSALLMACFPILLLNILCLAFFIPGLIASKNPPSKKQITAIFTFLLLAGGYFLLCFKANRYIEYAVPFATLEAAVLFPFAWFFWTKEIWPYIKEVLGKNWLRKTFTTVILLIVTAELATGSIKTVLVKDDYYQAKQYET